MEGSAWTLKIPLDRESKEYATYHLRDVDIDIYLAVQTLIEKKKTSEAIIMFIESHKISGDDTSLIKGNFVALQSAQELIAKIIEPIPGELKKN